MQTTGKKRLYPVLFPGLICPKIKSLVHIHYMTEKPAKSLAGF
ncbi:hypothetical protein HMPREF0083_02565 [Aneurinibacillus aneurinilyticus ATCC 12856]|jgi:hypothetical protein|uniref:Uncharacterized protein n=1 Tax=Aneurinibacillus aneurinilyticus ATCC 12856 TaxID=649747 RepID=U1YEV2_ANEAE|nr:hypothetical protein HMPREF0083_02565 [Aneurinibacillus aneurinilyticus ATCC 12856]